MLFSDVADSTPSRGAGRNRPERSRYFDAVQGVLERHGGTVEKFIGDAVMAVFGVPVLHEDDALRAVRAAAEINTELGRLNNEFESTWGVTITNRTGVETGEVIAGDPGRGQPFVVGEPVNTAARLEQSAHSGEILVGEATFRLVHDAVVAEPASAREEEYARRSLAGARVVPGVRWNRRLDLLCGAGAGASSSRDVRAVRVGGLASSSPSSAPPEWES